MTVRKLTRIVNRDALRHEKIGFNFGTANAVRVLIGRGELQTAREIWEASGATLRGVPQFDAGPIRYAIASNWGDPPAGVPYP